MTTDLISRIPGFSDMDMYNWCKTLKESCESTVVRKNKAERMFDVNQPVEQRINDSISFYLEKMKK